MKISFIGAGNMAGAIIKSVINSGRISPDCIYVYDKFEDKAESFVKLGVNKCESLCDAVSSSENILLAVKPQDYDALLKDIKSFGVDLSTKTFISIAAGISCEYVCDRLDCSCPVVRVMPNTPVMLGLGAIAISRNAFVTDKMYSKICTLFASCGCVCSLDESLMNKVIPVNGSSPVFVYMLAKSMIDKAVEYGISEKNAKELVLQTLKGSVEMLISSGMSPDELIKMVASPAGTTIEAIKSLEEDSYYEMMNRSMDKCANRADELAR